LTPAIAAKMPYTGLCTKTPFMIGKRLANEENECMVR
jgi:hypothetical protein